MLSKKNKKIWEQSKKEVRRTNNLHKKNIKRDMKTISLKSVYASDVANNILNKVALTISIIAIGLYSYFRYTA